MKRTLSRRRLLERAGIASALGVGAWAILRDGYERRPGSQVYIVDHLSNQLRWADAPGVPLPDSEVTAVPDLCGGFPDRFVCETGGGALSIDLSITAASGDCGNLPVSLQSFEIGD